QQDVQFRNQLALREYVDSRKEKSAQMDMARQALGAVSDNVGKIVTDIAGPVASAMADGVAEGAKSRVTNSQVAPQPQVTTAQSRPQKDPDLTELSDEQLFEAMQKSKVVEGQMKEYQSQFSRELRRRQTAGVAPTARQAPTATTSSSSAPVSEVDEFAEPEPLVDIVEDLPEPSLMGVDLDPNDFTVTE
ncbi:MAG: hypothetical protein ACTSPB_11925, partial [Candidatus Thorarchaeota archaeon]